MNKKEIEDAERNINTPDIAEKEVEPSVPTFPAATVIDVSPTPKKP